MGVESALLIASLASAAVSAYQGSVSERAQNSANDQAKTNALKTQQGADEANNRANAKSPDVGAMLAAAMAKGGGGSTSLTGPGGVDPSQLTLGKNTLLGGGPG